MQRMAYFISVILIHWIVIYPVDSAIHPAPVVQTLRREDIFAAYRLRNHCGKLLPAGNQQRISEL